MKSRMMLVPGCAAMLAAVPACEARAQAPADTDGLARATGTFIADSLVSRLTRRETVYIPAPTTAFDSAVAAILRATPRTATFASDSRPPSYEWIGTRGFTMRGDTAAVLVEWGSKAPSDGRAIDTYIEENLYLFVRDERGWRYVRREFVQGMDLGPVRG